MPWTKGPPEVLFDWVVGSDTPCVTVMPRYRWEAWGTDGYDPCCDNQLLQTDWREEQREREEKQARADSEERMRPVSRSEAIEVDPI